MMTFLMHIFKLNTKIFSFHMVRHMKLRTCSSSSRLALVVICALLIHNGHCDNRRSSNPEKSSHSPSTAIHNQSQKKWSNWTSSSTSSRFTISDIPSAWHETLPINVVPLTLDEYQRRMKTKKGRMVSSTTKSTPTMEKSASSKSSVKFYNLDDDIKIETVPDAQERDKGEKSNDMPEMEDEQPIDVYPRNSGADAPVDMAFIRSQALNFGKMVIDHFANPGSSSDTSRQLRSIFLDSNVNRQDIVGERPAEKQRGVIDWLGRLIGVQGKTLGEFLREYQVHVLYDLVFTFFKWIFFLYAGLLIP